MPPYTVEIKQKKKAKKEKKGEDWTYNLGHETRARVGSLGG